MSIADKITRLQTAKTAIAAAITNKGGTVGSGDGFEDFATDIASIPEKEDATWNQCNETVRNFLANVSYSSSDYSTTQITSYMLPSITPTAETKARYTHPAGKTVDGITFYNEIPNVKTPFATTNKAGTVKPLDRLRWIKGGGTLFNCRDLGGWTCDGGTVKYGLLLRGNANTANDRSALVGDCGVRRELDLRGSDVSVSSSPLGTDIKYYRNANYTWYALTPTDAWRENLAFVFEGIKYNEPIYFHCSAGADRTGTLACILEALLGMSQSDIDKDYELTSFSTGTNSDANARRRNESEWKGLINQITALSKGTTFRDKVVNWVADLGFSEAEINAFRHSMINGDPEDIHVIATQYSITNNLTHTINSNAATSANERTQYTATLTAESGYNLDSVTVTMGGTDITSSVYAGGSINIPSVTGNIVITAISAAAITNLFNVANAQLNKRWGSSSISSLNGAFITNEIPVVAGDVIYLKNYFGNNSVYREATATYQKFTAYNDSSAKVGARLLSYGDTSTTLNFVVDGSVAHFTVPTVSGMTKMVITLLANTTSTAISASDLSNVIITKNQPLT